MTITINKFYGGYHELQIPGIDDLGDGTIWSGGAFYLSTLGKRFIRASSQAHDGSIYLPPANELPLIRGGAVFTIWNEGYYNILIKDVNGGSVGCMQGTGHTSYSRCRTNVHLLDNSTEVGSWFMDCAVCRTPNGGTDTTDTPLTTGTGGDTTTDEPTTDDGDYHHHHQQVS